MESYKHGSSEWNTSKLIIEFDCHLILKYKNQSLSKNCKLRMNS